MPFRGRGARTDEYVAAMRELWSEGPATFHGDTVDFEDCILLPKPVAGSIPVHVGGHTEASARRAGRLGDGYFPGKGSHEELARLFDVVRSTAEEHGRDPSSVQLTTGGRGAVGSRAAEEVAALADMGVSRVIVPAFLFWNDTADALARYGDEVISPAR